MLPLTSASCSHLPDKQEFSYSIQASKKEQGEYTKQLDRAHWEGEINLKKTVKRLI